MKDIIFITLFFCYSLFAQQTLSEKINAYALSYLNTGDFSGCIVVSKMDSIIYQNCFGKANYSFNIDNTIATKFKIGSISKQFTAAAILLLEEKGLLNTNDRLSEYFPENLNAQKITIHQLLTHTSGIPDIFSLPNFACLSAQKTPLSKFVNLILQEGLLFNPGDQYQYSNGGYAILAQIIEQVSQKSYADFIREFIMEPLKMNNSGHCSSYDIINKLAVGYDPLGYEDFIVTDFLDNNLLQGSGSLYSNTDDLIKWINTIKNRQLLSEQSYEKFLKNYGNNYGYGISVYNSFDKNVFGHDGRINGYIADYLHYIEDNISVIILGNIQTGVADFFRRDIAAIIFNKEHKSRAKTDMSAKKYPDDIAKALGTYSFGPSIKVYIEKIDGIVKAKANEGGYSELVALNDGKFFSRTLYSFIEFKKDKNDKIIKMIWTNNEGNSFDGIKD